MKLLLAIAAAATLGPIVATAQTLPAEGAPADPVATAIQEFEQRSRKSLNEVTVVLPPPPAPAAPAPKEPKAVEETPPSENTEGEAVLVTGKPPEGTEIAAEHPATPAAELSEEPSPGTPQKTEGLAVRIETLNPGTGTVDPKQVKLLAPFPAKPISQPPTGWKLQASESAPPFRRKVEIAPGSEVTLTVRPHLLVPETDGTSSFSVAEPGYNPSLGYHQTATVGAILSTSIRQLDEEAKQLGTAIESLEQLLVSLPKPVVEEAPKAVTPPTLRKK